MFRGPEVKCAATVIVALCVESKVVRKVLCGAIRNCPLWPLYRPSVTGTTAATLCNTVPLKTTQQYSCLGGTMTHPTLSLFGHTGKS
jgi:hypothetical protein